MDGRAFLEVARVLARTDSEAHRRTAAGRAYYALMLEARDRLRRWGVVPSPRDPVHSFVRLKLVRSTDEELKQIGVSLEKLGKLRNDADYDLADGQGRFQGAGRVDSLIREATESIAMLDRIDGDEIRRAEAIAAIPRA